MLVSTSFGFPFLIAKILDLASILFRKGSVFGFQLSDDFDLIFVDADAIDEEV